MFVRSTGPKVSCRGHDETTGRGTPQSNGVGSGEGRQLAGPLPMGIPPTTRPAKDKGSRTRTDLRAREEPRRQQTAFSSSSPSRRRPSVLSWVQGGGSAEPLGAASEQELKPADQAL